MTAGLRCPRCHASLEVRDSTLVCLAQHAFPIRNGVAHQLKAGDVIIIPAGVGHWFTKIDDHIRYLMVRIDPDKVTPSKDEAASKADLKNGFKANAASK